MKKELESRRRNKKKQKEEKREARKANSNKGKGLDSMIVYVDENGHLSSTPPDPSRRAEIKLEDIQLGAKREPDEEKKFMNKGRVTYYNEEKAYGFIKDSRTREDIFFHFNNTLAAVRLNDHVTFEKVKGEKGINAVRVQKSNL